MPDEIVLPADVTVEFLAQLLRDAYIECEIDEDGGEVRVSERHRFQLYPLPGGKRVRMMAIYGFESHASLDERIALANTINDELIVIRAQVPRKEPDLLVFDYYLPIEGGVTRRAIVYAVKLFDGLISSAGAQDKDGIIA